MASSALVRRRLLIVLGVLIVAGAAAAPKLHEWWEEREEAKIEADLCRVGAGGENAEECEREGREMTEPADALLSRVTTGSNGRTPASEQARIRREVAAITARTRAEAPRVASSSWRFVGPKILTGSGDTGPGGRILDLAIDVKDSDTVYAATAGGGLFVTKDGGKTLSSAWPDDAPMSTSSVVQTPSGTLFVATGEAGPGGGSITYGGNGVWRSDDRGRTWKHLPGLEKVSRISRLVVDPTDEKRLFVAATGDLFHGSADRGVYRSEDAGKTWKKVLGGDNPTTGASDIAIDPKNPKILIAAMWDHIRRRDARNYQGVGSGVYRSTDGGSTWSRIATGIIGPNPVLGRIGVAIDPQSPQTIYVIASGGVGGHVGFFKSTDGGTTFLPIISPDQAGLSGAFTYGWWFGRVWVDPRNSSNVWTAGLDMLQSTDGGLTFSSSSNGMHVDQHALVWDPKIEGRMWAGNDGGLWRTDDGGDSWTPAEVEPFLQPDGMDVSEQDANLIVVGMQDNGEAKTTDAGQFESYGPGGDGQRVLVNPKNKDILYACGQDGACEVSKDGGASGESFENTVISVRKAFFMPIEFDLENPSTLYTGGEIMSRSDDDAGSWTPISPDLSDGGLTEQELNPLYRGYGALTAIGTAPKAAGRLYGGTDDGNLWFANSGGGEVGLTDWTQATDPDLPNAYVTRIEVDQANPATAYVTYSGFRGGDGAAYVLKTTDGGQNWDNITGDLPKAPVNDINIVGDKLVVAGDFGVYATRNGGTNWYRVGSRLPLLPVYELRLNRATNQLFAATFGRGVYKIGLAALEGLPATCAATAGFKSVRVTPKGHGLRFSIVPASGRFDVDVVQQARGRKVIGKRIVKRFRGKTGSFTWKGSSSLSKGAYFTRVRAKKDVRRSAFLYKGGRFRSRPPFFANESCTALRSVKLNGPAFGGRFKRPLAIAFRLRTPGGVSVTFKQRGKTLLRDELDITDRRYHRVRLPASKAKRGDVNVTLVAAGRTVRLTARRL
jgi:photosystem II stability/assembly factor-like uncharacterized protein